MASIANPLGGVFSSPSAPTSIISQSVPNGGDGGDASGWLSGLGELFAGAGTAVSSILRATNAPAPVTAGSGWVYNPTTQAYYDPHTGQQMTSTGTNTSQPLSSGLGGNSLILLVVAVLAFLLIRKKV